MALLGAVLAAAGFSLGLFGGGGALEVRERAYESGGFAYTGALVGGVFEGRGSICFQDGSTFEGFFSGGRFSGEGVYAAPDWQFSANFEAGAFSRGSLAFFDGRSMEVSVDGFTHSVEAGNWSFSGTLGPLGQAGEGVFAGPGFVYDGMFKDGLASGWGALYGADEELVYRGNFAAGLFDGLGTYFGRDGVVVEGVFAAGRLLSGWAVPND